jgi:Chaperone of endosialidase
MKIRIQSLRVVTLTLVTFALQPITQAVIPPPDGGYPGFNTAEGQNALAGLTTGVGNTAVGWFSLFSNTDGSFNTALGAGTLLFNVGNQTSGEGTQNTAIGAAALLNNTSGVQNTATGTVALINNTIGNHNTGTGVRAILTNTTGSNNVAIGEAALVNNTTGNFNIAVGSGAGASINSAFNCIAIGHQGADVNQSCFIGNIRGAVVAPDAVSVLIDSAGKLGTTSGSSRRFKKEIKPMAKISETILALEPVTFQYKEDKTNTPQFGLIAEEVAKINPDLVVRDDHGEIYAVRYDAVNAMLLNEFLNEHKKLEELNAKLAEHEEMIARQRKEFQTTVARQDNEIRALIATVKEQAAQIQRVSAQVEVSRAPLQLTAAESP